MDDKLKFELKQIQYEGKEDMSIEYEIQLLEEDLAYAEGKEKKKIENQIKQLKKRLK